MIEANLKPPVHPASMTLWGLAKLVEPVGQCVESDFNRRSNETLKVPVFTVITFLKPEILTCKPQKNLQLSRYSSQKNLCSTPHLGKVRQVHLCDALDSIIARLDVLFLFLDVHREQKPRALGVSTNRLWGQVYQKGIPPKKNWGVQNMSGKMSTWRLEIGVFHPPSLTCQSKGLLTNSFSLASGLGNSRRHVVQSL